MVLCRRAAGRVFRTRRAPILYLAVPCLALWLLCQFFGALPHLGGFPVRTYLGFVAPALAVAAALPATLFCGLTILDDRDAGLLEQMLATPSATAAVFLAEVGAAAAAAMAMAAVILVAGLLGGMRISSGLAGAAATIALAGLLGLACGGLSLLLGLLVPNRDALRNAGASILMTGVLCSTLLLPRSLLPGWLLTVAGINPVAAAIDGARAVCWPGPDWPQYGRDLLFLAAVAALSIGAAALAIARRAGVGLTPVRP